MDFVSCNLRRWVMTVGIVAVACSASAAPPPAPTPQPSPAPPATAPPSSLSAYAQGRRLRAGTDGEPTGRVVVSDQNLLELAGDAGLTFAASADHAAQAPAAPAPPDPKTRQLWRGRFASKRSAIRKLEERRAALDRQMAELRRGRTDARSFARMDDLRAKVDQLDLQLQRARDELADVVRQARQHGAEPGWFHGL